MDSFSSNGRIIEPGQTVITYNNEEATVLGVAYIEPERTHFATGEKTPAEIWWKTTRGDFNGARLKVVGNVAGISEPEPETVTQHAGTGSEQSARDGHVAEIRKAYQLRLWVLNDADLYKALDVAATCGHGVSWLWQQIEADLYQGNPSPLAQEFLPTLSGPVQDMLARLISEQVSDNQNN